MSAWSETISKFCRSIIITSEIPSVPETRAHRRFIFRALLFLCNTAHCHQISVLIRHATSLTSQRKPFMVCFKLHPFPKGRGIQYTPKPHHSPAQVFRTTAAHSDATLCGQLVINGSEICTLQLVRLFLRTSVCSPRSSRFPLSVFSAAARNAATPCGQLVLNG